jgi:hypothetical protein
VKSLGPISAAAVVVLALTPLGAASTSNHETPGFSIWRKSTLVISCEVGSPRSFFTCFRSDDATIQLDAAGGKGRELISERWASHATARPRRLAPGDWWRYKHVFGCHARARGLTCWNRTGHGFHLGYVTGFSLLRP